MKERVRPPKVYEAFLDRLKAEGVFESKQKALMFAAAVGFARHRGEVDAADLDDFGEGIRLSVFGEDEDYLDALAVATRNDLAVLAPNRQPERVELFERFAFLGLNELMRYAETDRPESPLGGVLHLLDALSRTEVDLLPGLDGLM